MSDLKQEYEQAFPEEQEYRLWIEGVERDFQEECTHRAGLAVTNRTRILWQENNEDFSPYATVNS